MLCYHVDAKDYEHEGLVEEEMDVEKTQVDEQKVETGFSTMFPAWMSYDNAPAVTRDQGYTPARDTRFLHRWICSEKQVLFQMEALTSPLSNGGVNKSSQVEANKSSLK